MRVMSKEPILRKILIGKFTDETQLAGSTVALASQVRFMFPTLLMRFSGRYNRVSLWQVRLLNPRHMRRCCVISAPVVHLMRDLFRNNFRPVLPRLLVRIRDRNEKLIS